jgi:adenylate cyclase
MPLGDSEGDQGGRAERDPETDPVGRLAAILRGLGATDDEIAACLPSGRESAGALALELALRQGPGLGPKEAAAAIGVSTDELASTRRALGLPASDGNDRTPADLVAAVREVRSGAELLLPDRSNLGLLRVVGSSAAAMAEAIVDAFRLGVEVPQLTAGSSYADVVEASVALTRQALPAFERLVTATLRAHLVRVANGAWAPDEEMVASRRQLFVAFADLTGYTALSRTLSASALTTLLDAFEDTLAEVVPARGGRVVKLIGDGAMLAADSAAAGCEMALDLIDAMGRINGLPPVRAGAAWGSVINRAGDYFGEVVNLAARLVALAPPSTVVVDETTARQSGTALDFCPLPAQAVKGYGTPPAVYRVTRPQLVPSL